jgi:hypothetical protein
MRSPDHQGVGGRAWKLTPSPKNVDQTATLGWWLLNVPGAHPFWSWWQVMLVHLRDIPGQSKPAFKRYPNAEYEFFVVAINPEQCPNPEPDSDEYPFLTPFDVVEQFDVKGSDRDAQCIVEAAVRMIVAGQISPDQDYRSAWHTLIANIAEHFRSGAHVEH